jgi:hypothetical protein|tara:strand:- start:15272 stop:15529 length:258 start_codon:yes stop_codon:yes gene_type:complete
MDSETSPELLSHHVGNSLYEARACLERENSQEADNERLNLIGNLEKLDADGNVHACIDYLFQETWLNSDEVEQFGEFYGDWLVRD